MNDSGGLQPAQAASAPAAHAAPAPATSARKAGHISLPWVLLGLTAIGCAMLIDIPIAARVRTLGFAPWMKDVLRILRLPGDYTFTFLVAVYIAARWRDRITFAAHLLIVTAIASAVAAVLKWIFGRSRPSRGLPAFDWSPFPAINAASQYGAHLSFPSGDATLAFATAAMFAREFPRSTPLVFGWALVVAVTRVLQHAHYPSDVTAGALLGILAAHLLAPRLPEYRSWPTLRRRNPRD